jgi:hypothetical protein
MGALGLLALSLLVLLAMRSHRLRDWLAPSLAVARLRVEPYWFRFKWVITHTIGAVFKRIKIHGHDQPQRKGLAQHKHSGKVMAHHHTSYPALVFLLLLSGVLTIAVSVTTRADSSASSLLSLTVAGSPPAIPATIDDPSAGDRFTSSTVTIRGTCPADVFVEIWRGGTFAGSTICDINNLYAVLVTLTPGQNDLVARVVDALGQYGPDSAIITVYYDAPPPPTPTPSPLPTTTPTPNPTASPRPTKLPRPSAQPTPAPTPTPVPPLLLTSVQHNYQGADTSQPVDWTITVAGGHQPYHFIWEWGDGSSDTGYAAGPGPVSMQHRYSKPGTYTVIVRAHDSAAHDAALQLVAVINGPTVGAVSNSSNDAPGNLIFVWPLLILASLFVLSFWLGERHKLATTQPLLHVPSAPAG